MTKVSPDGPRGISGVSRRRFLGRAGALSLFSATEVPEARSANAEATATMTTEAPLIDTNVFLGQWPFRRSVLDTGEALRAKLKAQGVTEAWAGHFDALLHKDIRAVNDRLVEACRSLDPDLFRPVGSLHPGLPDWRGELDRCVEVHGMRAIRLHPNYHGYSLADPEAESLLVLAAERGLLVQIAVVMEEERTQHPLVSVPPTDTTSLPEQMGRIAGLRVQLLNAFRTLRGLPLASLARRGVAFEIAMLEGLEGITNLLREMPLGCLCFGSYAPNFYFESATLKLRESLLSETEAEAVRSGNAKALLG